MVARFGRFRQNLLVQQGKFQPLPLFQVLFRHLPRQVAHPVEILGAFGDADGAPRIHAR
jgi:hypothetical protein